MLNNLNESKIQNIMNEVNEGKYDNYKNYEWDTLFLKFQQFYEEQGDETKSRFMHAERLIHSMKYDHYTKKFKSEFDKELEPTIGEYAYYRKRSHEIRSSILKAKYADLAWIGLKEYNLILEAINSYNQSFSSLIQKDMNSELITSLIRSVHLISELSNRDEKLKIDTLNIIIDNLEIIFKKKENIWSRNILGVFNALIAEDLKDLEGIEWSRVCKVLENAIQSLSFNESMRNSLEEFLKVYRSRSR